MPKSKRSRAKDRQHVWRYTPDPLLYTLKNPSTHKIRSIKRNLGSVPLLDGRLAPEARDLIHPSIRERIPSGSTRRKLASTGRSLSAAEEVLGMDIKKLHHLPATIDASDFFGSKRKNGGIYPIRITFRGHPEAKALGAKLVSTVYVSPLSREKYMVVAYGTQGSTKLAELPKGSRIHRFYDYGMPTQALALTTSLLAARHKGKPPRFFVMGKELTEMRRGINRPEVKAQVEVVSNADYLPEVQRTALKELDRDWDKVPDSEKQSIINSTIPWHRLLGIPWHVIDKNYHEIPKNFGASELPIGSVASQAVLRELAKSDPADVHFESAHLPVHEIDPTKIKPMLKFLKKAPPRAK